MSKFTIAQHVDLKDFSTLRIGGVASEIITIHDPEALSEVFGHHINNKPWYILGEGSNTYFAEGLIDKTFLKLDFAAINVIEDKAGDVVIRVDSGKKWDDLVSWAVSNNYAGIEALSAIPGTVGAAPVQNIGAYGAEFSNVCVSCSVYDVEEKTTKELSGEKCAFGYRDSLFKRHLGRYIVTAVTMQLQKSDTAVIPQYGSVTSHFEDGQQEASLQEIRDVITRIRWGKLPKPSELPNCGSFFKNSYVSKEQAAELAAHNPDMPQYPERDQVKIPSGWLIQNAGLKGHRHGDVGVYDNHALVLVNHGNATAGDITELIQHIQRTVDKKFGITLEPEVRFVS